MKVIIIEDEKPAARRLQRMLKELDIESRTMLHSVEESVNWFTKNEHPDIIFLDIQLSDGLSFEIFEEVDVKSAIIFTTAYDEYALKAFKLNSVDYLLKPIDIDQLKDAVSQFKEMHSASGLTSMNIETIKALFKSEGNNYKKRFTVKIGQHLKMISTQKISCFYSRYHSARYVGEQLAIRLSSRLDGPQLDELAARFSDMLTPGGSMVLSGALPVESDRPDIAHLQRLVVDFNRQDFGRLRCLIDALNDT